MAEVTLKLSIGNFMAEVTGPQTYADKKLEELVGRYLTSSIKPISSDSTTLKSVEPTGKRMSVAEFLKKKVNAKNQTDRAIALGYYIEKFESQPNFTTSEILQLGRTAKYQFTNVSDSVGRLVGRGFMMSAGEKESQRAYALTASGEEYIESMMSNS